MEQRNGTVVLRSPKENFEVLKFKGPERLQGEWWDGNEHARDHYVAETRGGRQLWVFREFSRHGDHNYFLHGYFD